MFDCGYFNDNESDIGRRNAIANLLEQWDLVTLVDSNKTTNPLAPLNQIKILPYKEKKEWELVAKYSIGRKK